MTKLVHALRQPTAAIRLVSGAIAFASFGIASVAPSATANNPAFETPASFVAAVEPAWSPGGTRLAFAQRDPTGAFNVYLVALDGSRAREIAPDARLPAWSPDGREIAFVRTLSTPTRRGFQYVVAPVDGSSSRIVGTSSAESRPSWSRNGRWLAFDGFESSMVARSDGTGSWTIPRSGGYTSFSPATLRLTFTALTGVNSLDVFTASPVGSRRSQLTRHSHDNIPLAWSSDGRRLLFESGRSGAEAIWVMDINGMHQQMVTPGREGGFSPTGSSIAVAARGGLLVADTAGLHRRLVVQGIISDPAWSADGRWIAFSISGPPGATLQSRIEIVHPDGTGLRVIAPLP
jgi:Tol biopolymer transport system component